MKAYAPGKVVLSGAYSVLEGAPAIVSAVDRYVVSDSAAPASLITPEVRAALGDGVGAPHFDASALRDSGKKLGLGSSAAILVASLAALEPPDIDAEADLRRSLEPRALRAHRVAQGGGSGIDVAASVWGGTLIARRVGPDQLYRQDVSLPSDLVVEVWSSDSAASTPELLASVRGLRDKEPTRYSDLFAALREAADQAVAALLAGRTGDFVGALDAQRSGLASLGRAANANIVTPEVERLAEWATARGAAVLPSGAGGGDIVLWVSDQVSPPPFRTLASTLGHRLVPLALHARGVHRDAGS